MTLRSAILVLPLALVPGIPGAFAQTPAEPAASVQAEPANDSGAAYESARNQLGVLLYCQEKGHIDGKAVETQTRLLAMVPPGDAAAGDAAEATGKAGTVSAMGVERSLADAAREQDTTEAALCQQMDALLAQLAAQVSS
ncbi:pore-forming ESAT-6 family protein [Paracoccus sp. (in: a-proteobacteria)]|uniref:pore-forming ESAT-6 family protein n=1 Tax=Paracoccus sp. TaxID=267 RepID=UPI00321F77BA